MSLSPKVTIRKPKRSNFDLSFLNRFSAAPGLLYPVVIKELFPADQVHMDLSSFIKTIPPIGPIFGSFKVQFDTFFIPNRYYNRILHDDRVGFDPQDIYFPLANLNLDYRIVPTSDLKQGCHPSSLWHFLGVPQEFGSSQNAAAQKYTLYRNFNAVPFLGYYEIFRSYYANTQESNFRYVGAWDDTSALLVSSPLSDIDDVRSRILSSDEGSPVYITSSGYPNYCVGVHHHYSLGGLVCGTYLPDRFNVWINDTSYAETLSKARIDTSSGGFTMDDLRFADKLNQMLQKTLFAGGRYSDWSLVQYGTSMGHSIEAPEFICSNSMEVTFEDIVQTSDAGSEDNPLGTLGSRGLGFGRGRTCKYYCRENGFLMTIMLIRPRVDYYQGVQHYLRNRVYSDLHVPTMDSIGFQDLLTDDLHAGSTELATLPGDPDYPNYYSVGKQPAWTELMSAVNQIHGDFADEDKLLYMTLARRYSVSDDLSGPKRLLDATTYIAPTLYNYAFADSSLTGQNFWVQLKVDFYVKRALSKRLMPSL